MGIIETPYHQVSLTESREDVRVSWKLKMLIRTLVSSGAISKKTQKTGSKFSSWWLNQPMWKNMLVKLDHFQGRGGNKKYLSCHHLVLDDTFRMKNVTSNNLPSAPKNCSQRPNNKHDRHDKDMTSILK